MGKGEIISHLGDGAYSVKVIYGGRQRVQDRITIIDARIDDLEVKRDAETDPVKVRIYNLQIVSLEKDKEYLENGMPPDPTISAWCADKTEDLSGFVGTIEVPGEDQALNIQPGYDGDAPYSQDRDGQLFPAIACSPDQAFFNKAILPGWQKWMPTYRYGVIKDIDYDAHTCAVGLILARSSQLSLNVNQGIGIQIGDAGAEYAIASTGVAGWEQFKNDNPSHPLVTNAENPQKLNSTDSLVAQIRALDAEVNSAHPYATDASYRKIGEHWDILTGNEPGDCEDHALTKADKLINDLGLSPRNMQIATCYTQGGNYHAVLTIPTSNHGTLVLDINTIGVKTKEQLDAIGFYSWDRFLINGNQWALDTSGTLFDVPVEYMNCNSKAFELGDEVVVKFTDQDFDQPKVIGFKSNPGICEAFFYWMLGDNWPPGVGGHTFNRLNLLTKAEQHFFVEWGQATKPWIAGWIHGSYIYQAGGGEDLWQNYYDEILSETLYTKDSLKVYAPGHAAISINDHPEPGRAGHKGFQANGKGHITGGTECCSIYEPSTGLYRNAPTKAVGDYSMLESDNWNHQYDPLTGSWSAKQGIGTTRMNHGAGSIGQNGFVWGGVRGLVRGVDTHEDWIDFRSSTGKYNPETDSWSSRANCNPYSQMSYGSGEGRLISFGGWYGSYPDFEFISTGEYFDDETNTWSALPEPPKFDHHIDGPIDVIAYHQLPAGAWQNAFYVLTVYYMGMYKYDRDSGSWSHFWGGQNDESAEQGTSIPAFALGGVIF